MRTLALDVGGIPLHVEIFRALEGRQSPRSIWISQMAEAE